jgi:hypothetical protein
LCGMDHGEHWGCALNSVANERMVRLGHMWLKNHHVPHCHSHSATYATQGTMMSFMPRLRILRPSMQVTGLGFIEVFIAHYPSSIGYTAALFFCLSSRAKLIRLSDHNYPSDTLSISAYVEVEGRQPVLMIWPFQCG